jgi:hypothetical protein
MNDDLVVVWPKPHPIFDSRWYKPGQSFSGQNVSVVEDAVRF